MDEEKAYRKNTREALLSCALMGLGGAVLSTLTWAAILWIVDLLDQLRWEWIVAGAGISFVVIFGVALRWNIWYWLQRDRVTRR
jgi:hypothetical protein